MRGFCFRLLVFITLLLPFVGSAQTGKMVTVKGLVTAVEDSSPLIGVSVIAGPTIGVTTLVDGTYAINVSAGTTLVYEYIGYEPVEFLVPSSATEIVHNVIMKSDALGIDDVVVVAYGVRKKGTIAGSVTTVKAEKINSVPAASFDQALQGNTPGLTVLSNTGEPNAPAVFQIRGVNSINSGTEPLFIMDGISISAGDFSAINPNDIESVSVLKDASSTSIYGARAANGVIVITTKRGKLSEKAAVSYRMQLGMSSIAHGEWDIMNTAERLAYERELGILGDKNVAALSGIDIDWRDMVFRDNAPLRSYEVTVSGATPVVNYFVSANYFRQEGIALGSDFRRYSVRTNLSAKATSWLNIGTNTMMGYEDIEEAQADSYATNTPISASRFMMPYWDPYKKDGSIAALGDEREGWLGTGQNPLEWHDNNAMESERYKVLSSLYAEIKPIEGLTLKTLGGVDFTYMPNSIFSNPSYLPNYGSGMVGRSSDSAFNLTWTNTANYVMDINDDHSFNFLLGHEYINNEAAGFSTTAIGQNNDKLLTLSSATTPRMPSDYYESTAYLSFFGRVDYNFKNKYYADFSLRGDSSSKFGASSRWAAFWSVGLMWNVRNEKFMEDLKWLTNAQVKFSTGTTGNSAIPPYDHLALVSAGPSYDGQGGLAPAIAGNENLTWESTWATNFGISLGFWNRLNVNVELYNKETTNLLMEVPLSYTVSGFKSRWDNVGAITNRGAEFDFNVDAIRTRDFTWNLSANVSYNQNRVKELYNGLDSFVMATTGLRLEVGRPLGEFYLNEYAGVNPANGDALWYTKDGEITNVMLEEDKVVMNKSFHAPWQGGFGTSVSWKGLSVSALFSWVADRWMINNDRYFDESNGTFTSYNQSNKLLYDRWKKPGDVVEIPRHGVITQIDSHLLEDASFLRLKNLTVSYSLPSSILKRTHFFEAARIYVQGQNLLTFTDFTGMDPESNRNMYAAQYPMSRQFTFGLEVTF